jgi:hypothetical protein
MHYEKALRQNAHKALLKPNIVIDDKLDGRKRVIAKNRVISLI